MATACRRRVLWFFGKEILCEVERFVLASLLAVTTLVISACTEPVPPPEVTSDAAVETEKTTDAGVVDDAVSEQSDGDEYELNRVYAGATGKGSMA